MSGVGQAVFMNQRSFGVPDAPGLFTWGTFSVSSGMLGHDDIVARSSPTQVGALSDWATSSIKGIHCIARKTNGTLWAWGQNGQGALGQNDTITRSSPVQVGALTTWASADAGVSGHSNAIKTNGELWAWGAGTLGALGLNDTIDRSSPVQVGALTNWSKVSTGQLNCAAVKTDGTLWTWGRNSYGGLGHNQSGSEGNKSSPTQVGSLTNWAQVSTNGPSTCAAIKTDGTLWTWGGGFSGVGGHGDNNHRSSPTQVGALTNWAQVWMGAYSCAAIKTDGTLWTWGGNDDGQLGKNNRTGYNFSPVQIGALTNWSSVSIMRASCLARKTDGTLWSWGSGQNGPFNNIGQNDAISRSSPVQIGSRSSWTFMSNGNYGASAIKT